MKETIRIDVAGFSGPLELLLELVRAGEIDPLSVSLDRVAQQCDRVLDGAGEADLGFLIAVIPLVADLVLLQAHAAAPAAAEAEESDESDRGALVEQLKQLLTLPKEWELRRRQVAALQRMMETRAMRFGRRQRGSAPADVMSVWDLAAAYLRILERQAPAPTPEVIVGEISLEASADRILGRLAEAGRLTLAELIGKAHERTGTIGAFLALLELLREQRVVLESCPTPGRQIVVRAGVL